MKRLIIASFLLLTFTGSAFACATIINVPAGCSCVQGKVVCP